MPINAVSGAKAVILQAFHHKYDFTEHRVKTDLDALLNAVLPLSDFVCRVCHQHTEKMSEFFYSLSYRKEWRIEKPSSAQLPTNFDIYPLKQNFIEAFQLAIDACETEPDLLRELRQFRQLQMAYIACFDLLHLQDIRHSVNTVSGLADTIINTAYKWLYEQLITKYGEPEETQSLQIMAMGKLGGSELNFSSDIDLIFAYPNSGQTSGPRKTVEHHKFFTTLAQKLIYALNHINEHGQCYRVDMRLRPMGDSGPIVMSYAAIETYYQDVGRAWERFALQKMRIINHNSHSDALYALIKPFVYRKYVDFTTIDSIREMKHLIEKEVLRRQLTHNIKLGRGGIREVEFFIQALQLIHAGRNTQCQNVNALAALETLQQSGFVSQKTCDELSKEYLFLRKIEQYLQIFDDEQTQTLPLEEANQVRLTMLLGLTSYREVLSSINSSMQNIHKHFSSLIEDSNKNTNHTAPHSNPNLGVNSNILGYADLWKLNLKENEAITLMHDLIQDVDVKALLIQINDFKQKLRSMSIGERGIRSIDRLMPLLLSELQIQHSSLNQNQVQGIFYILSTIAGRMTYVDLLFENPRVRQRLHVLCRKSLWVAQEIATHPILLDELLHPVYLQEDVISFGEWQTKCAEELRQCLLRISRDDEEAILEALRQFKNAHQLRIAAADISKTIPINQVSDRLSALAQTLLAEVVEQAWYIVTMKFGIPAQKSCEDKGFGIIAYGKFGGIELSYGSDLDIVCVYDANKEGETEGADKKPISHQEFYIKLVQKISHYCITKTYHGSLYEIDLRLRPSGNSGLLITHIDSFAKYQRHEAWTWEHQALVRSRPVFGSSDMIKRLSHLKTNILSCLRDRTSLKTDVNKMREKMRQHLDKSGYEKIDIKHCAGGIVDIEFMVQFWVLNNAQRYPELTTWSDNLRIIEQCARCQIIDTSDAQTLIEHYLWLRHLSHRLQLSDRTLASPSENLNAVTKAVSQSFRTVFLNDY